MSGSLRIIWNAAGQCRICLQSDEILRVDNSEQERMEDEKTEEEMVECRYANGAVVFVPRNVFNRVVYNMSKPSEKYITYKEGAEVYRMCYKKFRELAIEAGAAVPVGGKTLVDVRIMDDYLESCRSK